MEETMEMTMEPAADLSAAEPGIEEPVPAEPAVPALPEQDLIDFVREHPGLDARTIPQHVWQAVRQGDSLSRAVRQGDSLSRAYGRHELLQLRESNRQLQRQLGLAQAQNAARQRSLGSLRSAGGSHAADSFLAGFNDE